MNLKNWMPLVMLFMTIQLYGQDLAAYRIYDGSGDRVKYKQMVRELKSADFIFFGELHNNAIAHWLELEITKALHEESGSDLILAAEMFETDNQLIMDEYLSGTISTSRFEDECKLWPNYKTDYKPLVEFAKEQGLTFVASNVPRRYASLVAMKGFEGLDSLAAQAYPLLPPLPIEYDPEVPCYKNMLEMGGMGGHGNNNLPKAQALKDATMAHFTHQYWSPGKKVIHYNGSYHSDRHEGIVWYLKRQLPDAKILVISLVTQEDVLKPAEEHIGKGNYLIVVPETMTNTY